MYLFKTKRYKRTKIWLKDIWHILNRRDNRRRERWEGRRKRGKEEKWKGKPNQEKEGIKKQENTNQQTERTEKNLQVKGFSKRRVNLKVQIEKDIEDIREYVERTDKDSTESQRVIMNRADETDKDPDKPTHQELSRDKQQLT